MVAPAGAVVEEKVTAPPLNFASFPVAQAGEPASLPAWGAQQAEGEGEATAKPGAAVEEVVAPLANFASFPVAQAGESAFLPSGGAQQTEDAGEATVVTPRAAVEEEAVAPPANFASFPITEGGESASLPAGGAQQTECEDEAVPPGAAVEKKVTAPPANFASFPAVHGEEPTPSPGGGAQQAECKDEGTEIPGAAVESAPVPAEGAQQTECKDEAVSPEATVEEKAATSPVDFAAFSLVQGEESALPSAGAAQQSEPTWGATVGTGVDEDAAAMVDNPLELTPPAAVAEGSAEGKPATKISSAFASLPAGVVASPVPTPAATSSPTSTRAWEEDVGQNRSDPGGVLERVFPRFDIVGASLATPSNSDVSSQAATPSSWSAFGEGSAASNRPVGGSGEKPGRATTEPAESAEVETTSARDPDAGGAVAVASTAPAAGGDDNLPVQPGSEEKPAGVGGDLMGPENREATKAAPGLRSGEPTQEAQVAEDPPRPALSASTYSGSEDKGQPGASSDGNGDRGASEDVSRSVPQHGDTSSFDGRVPSPTEEGTPGASLGSAAAAAVVERQERAARDGGSGGGGGGGGEASTIVLAISSIVLAGPASVFSIAAAAEAHARSPLLGSGGSVVSVASTEDNPSTVAVVDLWDGGATTRSVSRSTYLGVFENSSGSEVFDAIGKATYSTVHNIQHFLRTIDSSGRRREQAPHRQKQKKKTCS